MDAVHDKVDRTVARQHVHTPFMGAAETVGISQATLVPHRRLVSIALIVIVRPGVLPFVVRGIIAGKVIIGIEVALPDEESVGGASRDIRNANVARVVDNTGGVKGSR